MQNSKVPVRVTMASWPPRIKYVERAVRSLLDQTMAPDSIDLNLSRQEFPDGIDNLPDGLLQLIADRKVTLNWEEGNTYVFRKEVPTIKKYYGEDYILLVCDDDCFYSRGYVERIVANLGNNDAYCSEPGVVGNRVAFRGGVFKPMFWERLTQEVIDCGISDTYIGIYLLKVGAKCKWVRDPVLDDMIGGIDNAALDHPNSERIGGYTRERCVLADMLSRKALGLL